MRMGVSDYAVLIRPTKIETMLLEAGSKLASVGETRHKMDEKAELTRSQ